MTMTNTDNDRLANGRRHVLTATSALEPNNVTKRPRQNSLMWWSSLVGGLLWSRLKTVYNGPSKRERERERKKNLTKVLKKKNEKGNE